MSANLFELNQSAIDSLNNALLHDSNWQVALHPSGNGQPDVLAVYCVQSAAKPFSSHFLLGTMPSGIQAGHLLACFDIAARYYQLGVVHAQRGSDCSEQEPKFGCD